MAAASPVTEPSQLGFPIATGLTAEVFGWGEGRVLKLYLPWVSSEVLEREFMITRAVHAAGVPSPAVFETLQIGNRHGIVFERIHGDSMVTRVARKPWTLFAAARQLAELHSTVHDHPAPAELPSQRERLELWINNPGHFAPAEKRRALDHSARLPTANRLCHGDFHPANILFTSKGPLIIDWSAATRGHPLADVARTSVLFETAPLPDDLPLQLRILMKFSRRLLHSCYLKRYLQLRRGTMEEIEFWRIPHRFAGRAWQAQRRAAMAQVESAADFG